jgi:hypothetical protein
MKKVHFLLPDRSASNVLSAVGVLMFFACSKSADIASQPQTPHSLLPEFFVEKGSDLDSSYISFRGVGKNPDTLEIQATSWGVIEFGLILARQNAPKAINYQMFGRCGTVFTHTWQKVTLRAWITATEADTLQQLSFTNSRDTISIVVTHTTTL